MTNKQNFYEKLESGYYRNAGEYPTMVKEPYVLRKKASDLTVQEITDLPMVQAKYKDDKAAYAAARNALGKKIGELEDEFKADLFAYHEVSDNPKAGLAFSIAWDRGHSSGYQEVAGYFDELVELIK